MKEEFTHIKQNREVRKNLIAIKAAIREEGELAALRELFEKEPAALLSQLENEDAKVRKNAALILGVLGTDACREALFSAYERETQRFVKSAYVTALAGCDCAPYLDALKKRRKTLLSEERTAETKKHIQEELGALNVLLGRCEIRKGHRFTGFQEPVDVILTAARGFQELTARQITDRETVVLRAGVKVPGAFVEPLLSIRTYQELLFCLGVTGSLRTETAAEQLTASGLLKLLDRLHEGEEPYRFRIECRSRMSLEQRSAFTKKLAASLETLTEGRLVNSTSDYEIELRLIETKEGGFYPLLKFFTLPDKRFSYRKCSVAASIRPAGAALLMELARPYFLENARVLDPFCGVGTMLLERNYLLHADTLYGVDLYGAAIKGARENAEIAHVPAHYVNRNFFDFTHEYPFDEIVTNLPVKSKSHTAHEIDFLYGKFFDRVPQVLKPSGMMFLYSHDRGFVKKQLREYREMELIKEWQIKEREESWFFVIRYAG